MATKRKSIIEEALLEAKSLEDALKANTKEMLAAHMKQEIENIVESSLKEEDEELELIDVEGSDETEEEMPEEAEMEDMEAEAGEDSEAEEVAAGLELDLDLDALAASDDEGEEAEVELDVVDLPIDLDMGDEEELDLTGASDEEVIAVFKKMSDEDEVEVVKDEDGIHLTDKEAGTEYYIKESEELDEGDDELCEGCGDKQYESEEMEEEIVYEIELDEEDSDIEEGHQSFADRRHEMQGMRKHYGEKPDGFGDHLAHSVQGYDDRMDDELGAEHGHMEEGEEQIDEDKTKQRKHGQRKHGARLASKNESRKSRKPISENRKPKNVEKVADSKILKEYKELKSKNEEYKKALKVFKNKLNEVALFNTNLAYVNRLFTEHSTTKNEKMDILKRFDSAESIKESKTIYKSIKGELENKKPITESVEDKVNKTVKSSKSDLNESTAYVDPQISAIKDLMKRIS